MAVHEEPDALYRIVRNEEDQYALWLDDVDVPDGWTSVGTAASKQACLELIGQLWSDMRPRRVKRPAPAGA